MNGETPNNGAAENCSGRQRASRLLLPAEPAAQQSRRALPPSAVSELESLADMALIRTTSQTKIKKKQMNTSQPIQQKQTSLSKG